MDFCAEQKKQEFCQAILDAANRPGQLPHLIHCRLTHLTPDGNATGELEIQPDILNPWNTVHGGALATLADNVTGSGVLAATGYICVTVNYNMHYLRPATGSKIICTARPEKLGKHLCVMHADLTNDAGQLVATCEFTFDLVQPLDQEAL